MFKKRAVCSVVGHDPSRTFRAELSGQGLRFPTRVLPLGRGILPADRILPGHSRFPLYRYAETGRRFVHKTKSLFCACARGIFILDSVIVRLIYDRGVTETYDLFFSFFLQGHYSVYQSVQRVVLANADVFARIVHGTALANQNIARFGNLTAEKFYAQALAFGFPTVLGATDSFLVCHLFFGFKR